MDLVHGFGVAGYRSFGSPEMLYVAPLSKVNLVAGQNNVGKSNLLRVAKMLGAQGSEAIWTEQRDRPVGWGREEPMRVSFAIHLSDADVAQKFGADMVVPMRSPVVRATQDDLVWVEYDAMPHGSASGTAIDFRLSEAWLESVYGDVEHASNLFRQASIRVSNTGGGGRLHDARRVFDSLNVRANRPTVVTLNAFRQISEAKEGGADHDGGGLIDTLANLDRPDAGDVRSEMRFQRIQEFVRVVLDDPSIRIEIPRRADTINIRRGEVSLPLENLGTGIHQVVILAAAATVLSGHLVCIEEPEVHLHPVLQRKLLRYLVQSTENQYLIATHSAHLLDSEVATIFHATWTQEGTSVRRALTASHRAEICADLGYRASDLVQANAVIWVEGPSDRIYVRHWLKTLAPDLIEGLHFSIMFYGGRLLNHLSANDPDVDDFISLRRMNRNVAIIIDSDKKSSRARVNATKRRVARELEESGLAWITKGYTIESLVPRSLLRTAIKATHPRAAVVDASSDWENPLDKAHTGLDSVDKVRIARKVVEEWGDKFPLEGDLRARVEALVTFVRTANGQAIPTLRAGLRPASFD